MSKPISIEQAVRSLFADPYKGPGLLSKEWINKQALIHSFWSRSEKKNEALKCAVGCIDFCTRKETSPENDGHQSAAAIFAATLPKQEELTLLLQMITQDGPSNLSVIIDDIHFNKDNQNNVDIHASLQGKLPANSQIIIGNADTKQIYDDVYAVMDSSGTGATITVPKDKWKRWDSLFADRSKPDPIFLLAITPDEVAECDDAQ